MRIRKINSDRDVDYFILLKYIFILTFIFYLTSGGFSFSLHKGSGTSIIEIASVGENPSVTRRIGLFLLALLGAFYLMNKKKNKICFQGYLAWSLVLFICWSFLSVLWTYDKFLVLRKLFVFGILILGALAIAEKFPLFRIIKLVLFSSLLFLLVGISAEIFLGTFNPMMSGYRFSGTINPNHQGMNCAVLIISALAIAKSSKEKKYFYFIIAVVAIIFLILTKSRTAFASVVGCLIIFWIFSLKSAPKILFTLSIITIILFIYINSSTNLKRDMHLAILLGRSDKYTDTLSNRIPLWRECFTYISKRPLLGYGFRGFWTKTRTLDIASRTWGAYHGHSEYLQMQLDLGLVGLTLYLSIFYFAISRLISLYIYLGNWSYLFCISILFWCVFNGILESFITELNLSNFFVIVVLIKLGFFQDYYSIKFRTHDIRP